LEALTAGEVDRLRHILLPVLCAAVNGAFEVTDYWKDHGQELEIPRELKPDDKEVYITDCMMQLPGS
jgi:hypothetical protein